MVEGAGEFSLIVEGELSLGNYAEIETRGGRVEWTQEGMLYGDKCRLTNSVGGGSITLDAAHGTIDPGMWPYAMKPQAH